MLVFFILEIGVFAYYAVIVLLQRFALRGRLIFGPDARSLYLTIGLIVVPVILFCSLVSQSLVKFFPDNIGRLLVAFPAVFTFYVSFFLTFYDSLTFDHYHAADNSFI